MERRHVRYAEEISHLAAEFFARESNGSSLITVTRADVSEDFHTVIVYISVFPDSAEIPALAFAKRVRTDFRDFVATKMSGQRPPTFDFELDKGGKNLLAVSLALDKTKKN